MQINRTELRRRRINAGLTKRGLSAAAKLAPSHITQIEAGDRSPSEPTLLAIADVLGCSVMDLLTEEVAA